jgi:hypothetical protein
MIQPRWVVGNIGESEWRVPVSAQRRVAVKLIRHDHRITQNDVVRDQQQPL